MRSKDNGFTVAELITVIAIVGVLASVALPVARFAQRREKEIELRNRLRSITTAIDRYHEMRARGLIKAPQHLMQGGYPESLEELTEPIELIDGKRVTLLRKRDLIDPVVGKAEWRTISSSDDRDAAFTDRANVYDLHSTSTALALDGRTRYNEW